MNTPMRHLVYRMNMSLLILGGLVFVSNVQAETYVAGQVGYTVPNKASDVDIHDSSAPPNSRLSDYS